MRQDNNKNNNNKRQQQQQKVKNLMQMRCQVHEKGNKSAISGGERGVTRESGGKGYIETESA